MSPYRTADDHDEDWDETRLMTKATMRVTNPPGGQYGRE